MNQCIYVDLKICPNFIFTLILSPILNLNYICYFRLTHPLIFSFHYFVNYYLFIYFCILFVIIIIIITLYYIFILLFYFSSLLSLPYPQPPTLSLSSHTPTSPHAPITFLLSFFLFHFISLLSPKN